MAQITKVYKNTTKETINVLGVGEIKGGDQVSITTEYQPPVNLANYPGLVDVSAEEERQAEVDAAAEADKASKPVAKKDEESKDNG